MLEPAILLCPGSLPWGLIQDHPVHPQFSYRYTELVHVHGFADVAVGPQPVALYEVLLLLRRGEYYRRQQPRPLVASDAPQNLQPINLGEVKVEQDYLWHGVEIPSFVAAHPEQVVSGFGSVPGDHHPVADVVLL